MMWMNRSKEKLKCIIFIPIVSQTYCDSKSFAWRHEFLAFNKQAQHDSIGMKVKLQNGNVASRILPVRIHELDTEDRQQIETEIGGVLRPVDFIYRSSGVVRPLLANEIDPKSNQEHTYYRDQVSKVAKAIKELIAAMKAPTGIARQQPPSRETVAPAWRKRLTIAASALIVLSVLAYGVFYFGGFKPENLELDKSIAVLPFSNLSSEEQAYLSEGLTDQLITSLAHVEGFRVASRTSIMRYQATSLSTQEIAQDLRVNYILEGSVQKANEKLRISVRLIRASDNFQQWSETFNKNFEDILAIQDEISQQVARSLGQLLDPSTLKLDKPSNPEAFDHFLKGEFLWRRVESNNIRDAVTEFKKSVQLDPQFAIGYTRIAFVYLLLSCPWGDSKLSSVIDSVEYFNEQALRINPELSEALYVKGAMLWWWDKKFKESEELFVKSMRGDRGSLLLLQLAMFYNTQGRLGESLPLSLEGFKLDPTYMPSSIFLGDSYFLLKEFEKAEAQYKQALKLYPANTDPIYRLGWLYCTTNRYQDALDFLTANEKYFNSRDPRPQIYLAVANAKLGKVKEAMSIINSLTETSNKSVPVFDLNLYLAVYYSATNQKVKMYAALQTSITENETDLIWLKVDPVFEPFRNEPRFRSMLKKVGFN